MNKTPFQLTREHVITYNLNPSTVGLWAWERGGELLGFCATRERAEALAADNPPRPNEVTLTLRQDQLVDLLHIIRAHKFHLEPNAHIPGIRSWYERVEAIQEQITSTIIRR